jgi:hypothetical protein
MEGLSIQISHFIHSILNMRQWATFSGTFATKDEAASGYTLLKAAGYSSTYPRYVSPRQRHLGQKSAKKNGRSRACSSFRFCPCTDQ